MGCRRRFMGSEKLPEGWYTVEEAPNGVYIYVMPGFLVKKEVWDTNNNNNVIGIALLTDVCRFVILHTEEGFNEHIWGGLGVLVANIDTSTDNILAQKDYLGSHNTNEIIAQLGASNAPAANYCRNITFKHGKKGYLGSLGELMEAYNNKDEINACQYTLRIGPFLFGDVYSYYWSSTQHSNNNSWTFSGRGVAISTYKTDNLMVRAFASL